MDFSQRSARVGLATAVVAGAGLRLARLGSESLWLDEVASYRYATTYSVPDLVFEVPLSDPHPPLYYVLLKLWTSIAGTSEVSLRFPSVVFGILSLPLTYLVGVQLYRRREALVATALVALSPFHVRYSQEARMYGLLGVLTLASMYTFLLVEEEPTTRRVLAYVTTSVLLGLTHVFGLFVLLAQGMVLLWRWWQSDAGLSSQVVRAWVLGQSVIALLLLPWVLVLVRRTASGASRVSWIDTPSVFDLIGMGLQWVGLSSFGPISALGAAVLAGAALSAVVSSVAPQIGIEDVSDHTLLVVLWVGVPVLVPFALSHLLSPIFVVRYTMPAAIGCYLAAARGVVAVPKPRYGLLAAGILLVALLAPYPTYYTEDQRTQWDEAAAYVERAETGDAVVVVSRAFFDRPFAYYYTGDAMVEGVPPAIDRSRLQTELRGHSQGWYVFSNLDRQQRQRFVRVARDCGRTIHRRSYVGLTVVRLNATGDRSC